MRSPPVVSLALLTIVANGAPAPATNFLSGTELGAVGQSAPEAPIALWTFSDSSKRSYLQHSLQKRSTPDLPPASDPNLDHGPDPGSEPKPTYKDALEEGNKILGDYQTHLSNAASEIKPAQEAVTRHQTVMKAALDAFFQPEQLSEKDADTHREAYKEASKKYKEASARLNEVEERGKRVAQRAHALIMSPEYKGQPVPWQPELVGLASKHAPVPKEVSWRTAHFF